MTTDTWTHAHLGMHTIPVARSGGRKFVILHNAPDRSHIRVWDARIGGLLAALPDDQRCPRPPRLHLTRKRDSVPSTIPTVLIMVLVPHCRRTQFARSSSTIDNPYCHAQRTIVCTLFRDRPLMVQRIYRIPQAVKIVFTRLGPARLLWSAKMKCWGSQLLVRDLCLRSMLYILVSRIWIPPFECTVGF